MNVETKLDADQMWSRVVTLHGRVEQALAATLQGQHGLGLSDYRVLCHLSSAEAGELRIQELADATGLDQSSVSRLVARLEKAGLVRREVCPSDRRGVYAVVTEAGRARQAEARPTYEATLSAELDRAATAPGLASLLKALRG